MEFRWNAANIERCTKHGCTLEEVEMVVRNAGRGYPRKIGNEKLPVVGRGTGDRKVEVIYLIDPPPQIYPIHAMPLTTRRRRG